MVPGTTSPLQCLVWFCLLTCLTACDSTTRSSENLCGPEPTTLTIGVDDPLVEIPDQRYKIDEGNQGGYHIDVSVRVVGRIDPDDVNILMTLMDTDTQGRHAPRYRYMGPRHSSIPIPDT